VKCVKIEYICVFMTCSTSYCLCDTRIHGMYVCMYCVCMYVCMYVCVYMCMYMCVCTYVCMYVYVYVCMYVCVCLYCNELKNWCDVWIDRLSDMLQFLKSCSMPGSSHGSVFKNLHFFLLVMEIW
jgi:hypothetical protein